MNAQKLWRTLIRVEKVEPTGIVIVIPGWDAKQEMFLDSSLLPDNIKFKENMRCHCMCNIGTDKVEDLMFYHWEPK